MKRIHILLAAILLLTACTNARLYSPCDTGATPETRELYHSMQRLTGAGTIFGHHDDTGYGVNWKYDHDGSDVKAVTGQYPAVYGWDLARIEHDSLREINGIPFLVQKKRITQAYERGGINTFSWHMDNPTDGKTAWDTTRHTVADIIPGGAFSDVYTEYLDRAAKYLGSLKGKNDEPIPVLFRPFHELTGNWFWWGKNTCTADEFKSLWKFTVEYLRNTKQLHNLLIVYSVSDFKSEADLMSRYPGDNYVDFIGVDSYCVKNVKQYQSNLDKQLAILDDVSSQHHKLSCPAETGYQNIPQSNWWTDVLLPVIAKHNASYLLTWRNAGTDQYFAPYPGQQSAGDFKTFSRDEHLIFQDRLTPLGVYGRKMF